MVQNEGKDLNEDTNFGKLKRIPYPPLQYYLKMSSSSFDNSKDWYYQATILVVHLPRIVTFIIHIHPLSSPLLLRISPHTFAFIPIPSMCLSSRNRSNSKAFRHILPCIAPVCEGMHYHKTGVPWQMKSTFIIVLFLLVLPRNALFFEGFRVSCSLLWNYRLWQIRAEPCKLLLPVSSKVGSKRLCLTTKHFFILPDISSNIASIRALF